MNKLEKWLWVNCTLKDNGQTSNSLYFYYKNLEIRYSDHMAKQSTGDLQIIKSSVFDSINYAVFIRGSAKIMIINASNTIDFIIHYAQQVHLNNSNLYITGISPINEWDYSLYKDSNITKHVERYKKDTQHDYCITTPTRFMSIDYLYNFVYNNVEIEGKSFKLQEVLIDNLEPPLEGNFG